MGTLFSYSDDIWPAQDFFFLPAKVSVYLLALGLDMLIKGYSNLYNIMLLFPRNKKRAGNLVMGSRLQQEQEQEQERERWRGLNRQSPDPVDGVGGGGWGAQPPPPPPSFEKKQSTCLLCICCQVRFLEVR